MISFLPLLFFPSLHSLSSETMPNSVAFIFLTLALSTLLSPSTSSQTTVSSVAKDQVSCSMCSECENPCKPLPPPPPPPPVVECPPPPSPPLPPPPPPPAVVECPPPPAPTCTPGPCKPLPPPPPVPPCPGGPYCKPPPQCPGGPNCRPPPLCPGWPNCRPMPPWMTPGIIPIYQTSEDENDAGRVKVFAAAFGVSIIQSLMWVASLCVPYYYLVI